MGGQVDLRMFAVLLNICGQVLQNLAAILMSRGQNLQPGEGKTWMWHLGISLLIPGALAVFASYSFAEQSLLASLISVQFISNVAFSRFILGKLITIQVLVGTGVIVLGTIVCILNAPRAQRELDSDDIRSLFFENRAFEHFLLIDAGLWIALDKAYMFYRSCEEHGRHPPLAELMLPCCFVARAALPGSFSIMVQSAADKCTVGRSIHCEDPLSVSMLSSLQLKEGTSAQVEERELAPESTEPLVSEAAPELSRATSSSSATPEGSPLLPAPLRLPPVQLPTKATGNHERSRSLQEPSLLPKLQEDFTRSERALTADQALYLD